MKETHKRKIEQQLSLEETQELSKHWDINDARSQHVHKRIGKILAVDCQPLSMVEDVGFKEYYKFWSRATSAQVVSISQIQLY